MKMAWGGFLARAARGGLYWSELALEEGWLISCEGPMTARRETHAEMRRRGRGRG
jgi:hypothetical protein